jgi:hypothetical protein
MYQVRTSTPSFSEEFLRLPMPIFENLKLVDASHFRSPQPAAALHLVSVAAAWRLGEASHLVKAPSCYASRGEELFDVHMIACEVLMVAVVAAVLDVVERWQIAVEDTAHGLAAAVVVAAA